MRAVGHTVLPVVAALPSTGEAGERVVLAANGQTYRWDATAGAFVAESARASARVYHDAAQAIANNTFLTLAFNQERWDSGNMHDPATNNSRLTCREAGRHMAFGHVVFSANATGERRIQIVKNGATTIAVQQMPAPTGTGVRAILSIATMADLAVNDYLELQAYHEAGTGLTIDVAAQFSPEFSMAKL